MGFQKVKTGKGSSAILVDGNKMEGLERAYGLKKTPETPETSETSEPNTGITDVSDVTDVLSKVFEGDSTPLFYEQGGDV